LVDVTGRRAALRAGVVTALVAGLLVMIPMPAQAQNPDLRLDGIGSIELRVGGGAQSVQIKVENRDDEAPAGQVGLTMTVPLADLGVHIASAPPECGLTNNNTRMDCTIAQIPPGQTWVGLTQVSVHGNSPLQAGETRNGTAQVVLSGGDQQQFNVRLEGPERPPGVPEVSGFVTDEATGERIEGAAVLLVDSQNAEFRTGTNGNGEYRFAGEAIAPGALGLRASKEGFEGQENIQQGQAGQPLTGIQLTLRSTAAPTPSATPTPTPTPTATSTPAPVAVADSGGSGGSFFTTLLVVLGLLLVLLGVGAIGLLIIRRRRERAEDEGPAGAAAPTSGPRGPRPGGPGGYRPPPAPATQVMRTRGGPLPAVGPSPALADAPTMLQQRVGSADQTAVLPRAGDPPGPRPPAAGSPPPPRPAAPTYGTPSAGSGDPRGRHAGAEGYEGYGGRAGPGGPAHSGGPAYGHQQPGYQPADTQAYGHQTYGRQAYGHQTYDTQAYDNQAHDNQAHDNQAYGDQAYGGSGPGGPGYGSPGGRAEPGGYAGEPPAGRHGHGGYGPGPEGGPYGPDPYLQPGQPTAGYPPPSSGYGQPPYPPGYDQSGYRQQPDQQQPGYRQPDPPDPYYDEAGQPRSRHSAEQPPERRRLDWLDD
jgi:hypothetical protein